jgi:hypothetical protein
MAVTLIWTNLSLVNECGIHIFCFYWRDLTTMCWSRFTLSMLKPRFINENIDIDDQSHPLSGVSLVTLDMYFSVTIVASYSPFFRDHLTLETDKSFMLAYYDLHSLRSRYDFNFFECSVAQCIFMRCCFLVKHDSTFSISNLTFLGLSYNRYPNQNVLAVKVVATGTTIGLANHSSRGRLCHCSTNSVKRNSYPLQGKNHLSIFNI